ncbi:hypothetical protein COU24_03040 [Candidatus Kuenenbacteria bacterium CG10_big_fil_rev_8_21_14_0_10_39_14]|nr:MAG: hypothetical protein COW86_04370 [Candidatus Kuenenbacteria bacterium CG22_combo_CG10-13_8_21_14_all_39_9]PIR80622.1 MAG: hypothetical protein COU24_03040 [Candidatus Kuenenbacteria bacterium CG10_big_fil_rev_8_21_14_0_10_39_14]
MILESIKIAKFSYKKTRPAAAGLKQFLLKNFAILIGLFTPKSCRPTRAKESFPRFYIGGEEKFLPGTFMAPGQFRHKSEFKFLGSKFLKPAAFCQRKYKFSLISTAKKHYNKK